MKKFLLSTVSILTFSFSFFAQLANDFCSNAQTITPNGSCVNGTTVGADDSWLGSVGCQGGGQHPDVWYTFTATAGQLQYTITPSAPWTGDVELIVVSSTGACANLGTTGFWSDCGPGPLTGTFNGFQPGTTYYFTVSNTNTGTPGPFQVCMNNVNAPVVSGQDCGTAAILCDGSTFSQASSTAGFGTQEINTSNSCWGSGGERQSKWFKFTIGCSGTLEFNIRPNILSNDYDWALFNVTSNPLSCASMGNSVACNWSGCTGSTGMSSCPASEPGAQTCGGPGDPCLSGNSYRAWANWGAPNGCNSTSGGIAVTAGQTYALLVDNFTTSNNGFSLTFGGACGTGTAIIGPNAAFTASPVGCSTYNFSKTCQISNGSYTFNWSFGDGNFSTSQNPSHTYTTPGTYIVTLEATDALGCTAFSSMTITVGFPNAQITANPGLNLTCASPTTTLTASGGVSYVWSTGANTAAINVSTPGTYTVTVTGTNGCTATASATVTSSITPPTAGITNNTGTTVLTCTTTSISLTATGGVSYVWSGGLGTNANASVTAPGTYTVTVTAANGCTATSSITITQNITPPTPGISSSNGLALNCNITSTTLTASGGVSYLWSTGETTAAISVTTAGTFTVTVTGTNGCTATSSLTTTLNNTPPTAGITASNGLALNCTVTSTNLTANGTGTYLWSTGATSSSINVTTAGTFTVTVTGANGCTISSSVTTTLDNTPPTAGITASNGLALNCNITSTDLSANGTGTYLWSTGATTSSINVTTAGTFTVTVTGANGCTVSSSVTTTLNNTPPTAGITASNGLTLNCNITSTDLSANGTGTYLWSTGATTSSINVTTAGTFTVTVTGANGCTVSSSVTTTLNNTPPVVNINNNNGLALTCAVPNTTLTATGGGTYLWSTGATTAGITVSTDGTFTVTVTGANGCTASSSVSTTLNNTPPTPGISNTGLVLNCLTTSTTLTGSGGVSYSWSTGATTAGITVSSGGTYTVTVTGANGCTASISETVTSDPAVPVASAGTPQTLTCAVTSVNLNGSGSSMGPEYTYNWTGPGSFSSTDMSPTGITVPGTYTIVVTNTNNSCTAQASVVVSQNITPPSVVINSDNGLVLTCDIPSTTLTAGGGTGYAWSTGAFTSDINVTTAGTFTVTVTGSNGCTATSSVTTTLNNSPPVSGITASSGLSLTCLVTSTSLSANGTGTYLWSNGATTSSINVNTPGTFTVTVTGTNGCTISSSVTTTLDNTPPASGITASNGLALNCNIPSTTLTADGSGTYLWSTGATSSSINVATAGTFTVTVTGANGCTVSTSVATSLNTTSPALSISNTNGLALDCATPNTTLIANGTGTFAWSTGATTSDILVNAAGTFTVTLTGGNGCTASSSVTTTLNNTPPTVGITNNNGLLLTCAVTSTTLTASGGGTYVWNNGSTNASLIVNDPGTFTVTVTSGNGCTASQSVMVNEDVTAPVAGINNLTGTTVLTCTVTSIDLTATGGGTYQWSASLGTNPSVSVSSPGDYTVTVTSGNGCTSTSVITITADPSVPVVNIGTAPVLTCSVTDVQLNAIGSSAGPEYSYTWSGPGVVSGGTTLTPTVNQAGIYTITVSNTNNGCTASGSVTVNQNTTAPVADAGATQVLTCTLTTTFLDGSGSSPNVSYQWTTANGNIISGANTVEATVNAPGTYTLVVTDLNNGCTSSDDVIVTQNVSIPDASAGADQEFPCAVNSIQLTGSSGVAGVSYTWSAISGTITSGQDQATVSVGSAGVYVLQVTDPSNSCTQTDTVVVTAAPAPSVSVGSLQNISCFGLSDGAATATASGGTPAYNYAWSNSTTGATLTGVAAGSYTVTVIDANSCTATASATITQPSQINLALSDTLSPDCGSANGSIEVIATGGTSPYSYSWQNSTETTPVLSNVAEGVYVAYVSDDNGCSDSLVVNLDCKQLPIFIPQLISPNGDGKNDTWIIVNLETYPNNKVKIFNRWGNEVFVADPYLNDWDGTSNNVVTIGSGLLPAGTYFYIVDLFGDGSDIRTGYLELQP